MAGGRRGVAVYGRRWVFVCAVLASMVWLGTGCRAGAVRDEVGASAALAIEVGLGFKGLAENESARGRLWLRLMPEGGGVARECVLEWWSDANARVVLSSSGGGPEGPFAWFPTLSPGRYRLSSFVVVARIDGHGGGFRSFKVAGRLEPSVGFVLESGELRFPGRLELRLGVDRTYVFGFTARSLSTSLRRKLARAAGRSGLKVRADAPERIDRMWSSGRGEDRSGAPVCAKPRPSERFEEGGGATLGERVPVAPPGDAALGVRLRLANALAQGERAAGTLQIVVRSLSRPELQSVELGWAIAGDEAQAALYGAGAEPLGDGKEVLLALGLGSGAYELRAIEVEGRIDGRAGRAYVGVRTEVPGLPVFEVRSGVLSDLGTLAIEIEGHRATLRLTNRAARAASGSGERARALSALARALGGPQNQTPKIRPTNPR